MTVPRPETERGLVALARRRPITSFFVLAYGVTWLLWLPGVVMGLAPFDEGRNAPALWVMPGIAVGVTGSAFLMTAVTQGRAGVRRLLQRLATWRVGLPWVAVAVLLIPLSEILVTAALGNPDILRALTPSALLLYPAAYVVHFFFGPLFEESGWRGFALPRMQHRFGPARGTLLLGLLWTAWHFLLYVPGWAAGGVGGVVSGIAIFTAFTVPSAFLFTWLSNNTRASLLMCVLLHGSIDGTGTYLNDLAVRGVISADAAGFSTVFGVLIAAVLWTVGLLVFTRGRLGYPRYRAEAEQLDLDPAAGRATPDQKAV